MSIIKFKRNENRMRAREPIKTICRKLERETRKKISKNYKQKR